MSDKTTDQEIAEEAARAVLAFGELVLKGVYKLIPTADVDLDKMERCEIAITRMFFTNRMIDTPEKIGATVGIMSFAIAQNIQAKRRRGIMEFGHEDEYRERILKAPLFQQVGVSLMLDKSTFSNYRTPKARDPKDQPFASWLFSQMVYTAALYGNVPEAEAKLMSEQWGAVEWDVLHTDPERATQNFKRFRNRNR